MEHPRITADCVRVRREMVSPEVSDVVRILRRAREQ